MGVDGPTAPTTPVGGRSVVLKAQLQGTSMNRGHPLGHTPPIPPGPKHRSSAPGNGRGLETRSSAPQASLPPSAPPGILAQHQSGPVQLPTGTSGQLQRLPSVERSNGKLGVGGSRPTSAYVAVSSSYRVQVDDYARGRPETVQEVRAHCNHVQALAFAKEPETLADNVMVLKRERNSLLSDKQMLLVNKRRLEAILGKILGLSGLEGLEDDELPAGAARGKGANPMKAKMMKVLDDSKALDNKLSGSGGAAAGLSVMEAEAKIVELNEKVSERERMVGRLEGEISYRRTQAAAVTSGLQKQLTEAQTEADRNRRKAEELEGHLEFQVGELSAKVAALTQQLAAAQEKLKAANEKLSCDTGTMSGAIEELKKAVAALEAEKAAVEAEKAAAAAKVAELEHTVVQRENTVSELMAEKAKLAEEEAKKAEEEAIKAEEEAKKAEEEAAKSAEEAAAKAVAEEAVKKAAEMCEAFEVEGQAAAVASAASVAIALHFAAEAQAAAAAAEAQAAEAEAAAAEALMGEARQAAVEDAEHAAEAVASSACAVDAFAQFAIGLEVARAAELIAAKEKIVAMEAEIKELEGKVSQDVKDMEAKSNELLKAKEEALAAATKAAEEEKAALEKAAAEAKAAFEAEVAAEKDKAGKAGKEKADLTGRVTELEAALKAKTERVAELEQQVMAMERELKDLKALMAKKKGFCG